MKKEIEKEIEYLGKRYKIDEEDYRLGWHVNLSLALLVFTLMLGVDKFLTTPTYKNKAILLLGAIFLIMLLLIMRSSKKMVGRMNALESVIEEKYKKLGIDVDTLEEEIKNARRKKARSRLQ